MVDWKVFVSADQWVACLGVWSADQLVVVLVVLLADWWDCRLDLLASPLAGLLVEPWAV